MIGPKAFNRFVADQMAFDNFGDIFLRDAPVPNPFGINHHRNSFSALIKATRFVDPNFSVEPSLFYFFFHRRCNLFRTTCGTADLSRLALVDANKNMFFKSHTSASSILLDDRQ